MKIIAISGSLRPNSSNTALLYVVAKLAPKDLDLTIYKGLADLPHFTPELDGDTLPRVVKDWRTLLEKSDGVMISTPEYAYGMPGVLKNGLDWIVSSGELVGKPVATISASPSELGGSKAHASLVLTLTALAANLVEGGSLTIPFIGKKLNANGELIDINTVQSLKLLLDASSQDVDLTSYLNKLKQRVQEQWLPGRSQSNRRTVLNFTINRSGEVNNLNIVQTSGFRVTDEVAMNAIQQAAPFAPLPTGYRKNYIDIEFTFDINVYGELNLWRDGG